MLPPRWFFAPLDPMNSGNYVHLVTDGALRRDPPTSEAWGAFGAELAALSAVGAPVPPGFAIEVGATGWDELEGQVFEAIAALETATGRRFGDPESPLLLAVRGQGTVLDLGLDSDVLEGLERNVGRRFALDCHRRFLARYGASVLGVGESERVDPFQAVLLEVRRVHGWPLSEAGLADAVQRSLALIESGTPETIPKGPKFQLADACRAVSANFERPVIVQAMVYGNRGKGSATGVVFTHDPVSGARRFFGEYLPDSQGDDVDLGAGSPLRVNGATESTLEDVMPEVYAELREVTEKLEVARRESLDVSFVVEEGRLWITHASTGQRGPKAAIRIAVDYVGDGLLEAAEALERLDPDEVWQLLDRPVETRGGAIAKGLAASPGTASGAAVFSREAALARGKAGESVILVVKETEAIDVPAMQASAGVVTARGGLTCHAAIAGRALGKPTIVGTTALAIDAAAKRFVANDHTVSEGDAIRVDGGTGRIDAAAPPRAPSVRHATVMEWAQLKRAGGEPTSDPATVIEELGLLIERRLAAEESA